jgi:16S rRNA (cytosine1402-N4)-methyltransferase
VNDVLTHQSVLLHEAVAALAIKPDGIYVDCTFGRGGHSALILEQLGQNGRLIALDKDRTAVAFGKLWDKRAFHIEHCGFTHLTEVLNKLAIEKVDGILLDLGVSSPQLDEPLRGFSFRFDAPLDMRMDNSCGLTAAQWLATVEEKLLTDVIRDYGEERYAKQISRAIVMARAIEPILTTGQLAGLIGRTIHTREAGKNPATRTFQAIRIYLNGELDELEQVLPQCVGCMNTGARLVVISFHSLEDRLVKNFFRNTAGADTLPRHLPVRASEIPQGKINLIGRAIKAGDPELQTNPRARSAVMRIAERRYET